MPNPPTARAPLAPLAPLAPIPAPSNVPNKPTLRASVEGLLLAAALYWTLAFNGPFLRRALAGRDLEDPQAWLLGAALLVGLVALKWLLAGLLATRHTVKPLLALLTLAGAASSYFIGSYGVVLDPSMMRNVLRTNPAEAGELLSGRLLLHALLYAVLPLVLLWKVQITPGTPDARSPGWRGGLQQRGRTLVKALGRRAAGLALALLLLVGAVLAVYQPLASLMRNHKELRYLVTPANVLWSTGSVLAADLRGAARPREPIGLDVQPGPSWAHRQRPLVLLLVVGETVRAANWGLSGYERQTTPALAAVPGLVNFPQVTACGTNTETSLPGGFAPVGRRDYDEARIRGQESLLHVAARAGVAVHWRDNQSGCKGVCDGLPQAQVVPAEAPGLCPHGSSPCLDEALLVGLEERLQQLVQPAAGDTAGNPAGGPGRRGGTHLWVLHLLGNHGPAYHRRVPPAFERWQPSCRSDDLSQCTQQAIANAYDNAVLYTDHVLASAVARLQAHAGQIDAGLVFVSDHGESLGEHGLYLHGLPFAIAPAVQKQVPMVAWVSPGLEAATGLKPGCLLPTLQRQAAQPLAHDHLFHTLLGLLDLRTRLHEPSLDLSAPCR